MEFKSSTMEGSNIKICNFKALNKDAFVELVQENRISLYRLSKSILKNEADVEDAVSETILKAYKNLHKLKTIDSFKPWIMKILVNECYSIINKAKKLELKEDFSDCEGSYEEKSMDNLIYYVNKLEDEFKAVVILFYYEDISIKDISMVLSISAGTVKSRLNRAKSKLKTMMETI